MINKNSKIKVGDKVQAIVYAWASDETPTDKNFFSGTVKEIIRKGRGIVYIQIEKLEKQIPEDRCLKLA